MKEIGTWTNKKAKKPLTMAAFRRLRLNMRKRKGETSLRTNSRIFFGAAEDIYRLYRRGIIPIYDPVKRDVVRYKGLVMYWMTDRAFKRCVKETKANMRRIRRLLRKSSA